MEADIIAEPRSLRAWLLAAAVSLCLGAQAASTPPRDPALRNETWLAHRESPLPARVAPIPAALLRALVPAGAHEAPHAVSADDPLCAELRAALSSLPAGAAQWARRYVMGFLVAEDMGATAQTLVIEDDEDGRALATLVVIDANRVRGRTASEWATAKDRMAFRAAPGFTLSVRMDEGPRAEGHAALLQYVLLHEIGHALAFVTGFDAYGKEERPAAGRAEFFDLSWLSATRSRFDARFPERERIAFYGEPGLDASRMAPVFERLSRTSFPTLYAATNPGDDFAESFANYVHTQVLGRPYEVIVGHDGREQVRLGPCWDEPRCAAKKRLMETLLIER